MASEAQPQETKTLPIKIFFDKQTNKVVAVEATNDFVDTLFSFLSLPLGTITRLVAATTSSDGNNDQQRPEPPFLSSINNLYQSVQNLTPNDVWNPVCKEMLLRPRNPCEALCSKLVLNVDDTEPATKVYVCASCDMFTTFPNLVCTCGKPVREPKNLDSEGSVEVKGGVFVKGTSFLVFDDLKIVPSSFVTFMPLLLQMGYSDLTQLEEITQNIGMQEVLKILKCALTSHEPLTNAILGCDSKQKDNSPDQFASAVRARPNTGDSKIDVKVVRSKSQKKIIFAEVNEDFTDLMFSFLTIPLGSIVKLLGGQSFVGCVDNLYKSVETLDSSWCTESRSVLLNPGLAPQFGCANQPLNIPDVEPPSYYYGTGTFEERNVYDSYSRCPISKQVAVEVNGGVISKSKGLVSNLRTLTALDPRSPNRLKEGSVGFVKRPASYGVGDDLKVKLLSAISCISYLKELSLPLDDIEVKVYRIGEAEALSLLGASLTSKSTLTSGLEDFLDVPKQGPTLTSKVTQTSQLDDLSMEEPKPEAGGYIWINER